MYAVDQSKQLCLISDTYVLTVRAIPSQTSILHWQEAQSWHHWFGSMILKWRLHRTWWEEWSWQHISSIKCVLTAWLTGSKHQFIPKRTVIQIVRSNFFSDVAILIIIAHHSRTEKNHWFRSRDKYKRYLCTYRWFLRTDLAALERWLNNVMLF